MNKIVSAALLIAISAILACVCISRPAIISDGNIFLKEFSDGGLISFMGILVPLMLASTATLHIEMNNIERIAGRRFLQNTRKSVRMSAFSLIGGLSAALILSFIKPIIATSPTSEAITNSIAIIIPAFSIIVLRDMTRLAFRIDPNDVNSKEKI